MMHLLLMKCLTEICQVNLEEFIQGMLSVCSGLYFASTNVPQCKRKSLNSDNLEC